MKALRRWTLRLLSVPVAMLPGSCHYNWTAPLLWSHQSSWAAEWFAGLWVLSLIAFALTICFVWIGTGEEPKHGDRL